MKMENFKDSVFVEAQQDSLLYDYSMECWPYDETSIEFMEAWKEIYECTPDSITPVMVYKYELDAVVIKLADIQRQNTILALSILVIIALVALVGYIIYRRVKGKMKKEEFAKRLLQQQAATLPIFADKVNKLSGKSIKFSSSLYDEFQKAIDMVKGARKSGIIEVVNDNEFLASYPYLKDLQFLTPQEKMVLIFAEENFTTAEIALYLGISDNTVRAIKTRIRSKLAQADNSVKSRKKFKILKH